MRTISRLAPLAIAPVLASMFAIAPATALPNPPYQGDPAYAASGAPQPYDRYGGGSAHPVYISPNQPDAAQKRSAPGTYLGWNGKSEIQPPQAVMPAQGGGWSAMTQRWNAQPQAQAQAQPAPQQAMQPTMDNGWRPLPVQATSQPAQANLYDVLRQKPEAPQQPAPPTRVANSQGGPRFYSLHREYGLQPDAIPLPPQFFGPTADLSTPNTDPVVKRTTTVNGKTQTVVVPEDPGPQ